MRSFKILMTIGFCALAIAPQVFGESSALEDFEDIVQSVETPPQKLDDFFEKEFPYYFKYCATSKFHPKKHFGVAGGSAGHAVFFIKGACQDLHSGPSRIMLCPDDVNLESSAAGVGISVNKHLSNVNFFIFPTLEIFLGRLQKIGFSWAKKGEVVREAIETQAFKGVLYHDDVIPPLVEPEHYPEFMARDALGTDFGLTYARNLHCVTVPMTKPVVGRIVDYLNSLNDQFDSADNKSSEKYHWHGIYNNCVHPAINALASVGVLEPIKTDQNIFCQLNNLGVPSSTFVYLHDRLNYHERSVDDYYSDFLLRDLILQANWFPELHGGFAEHLPMQRDNEIYHDDETLLLLDRGRANEILRDERWAVHRDQKGYAPHFFQAVLKLQKKKDEILRIKQSTMFKESQFLGNPSEILALEQDLGRLDQGEGFSKIKEELRVLLEKRKESLRYVTFVEAFEQLIHKEILHYQGRIAYLESAQ